VKTRTLLFLIALICLSSNGLATDNPASAPAASGEQAARTGIVIDTDDSCRLTVDDQDKGIVTSDHAIRVRVTPGSHIVKCVSDASPDLIWRKTVDAKRGEQATALIALKALHTRLDQAIQEQGEAARDKERRETERQQADIRMEVARRQCQESCSSRKKECGDTVESDEERCNEHLPGDNMDLMTAGGQCPMVNLYQCQGTPNPGACIQEIYNRRAECVAEAQRERSAGAAQCSERSDAAQRSCATNYQACVTSCAR
jgi:hypothetical protein